MPTCTQAAAGWLVGIAAEALPEDVRAATRLRLLDVLGLALAAASTRFGAAARRAVAAMGGSGTARTLPFGRSTSPELAAFSTGALSQALQFDDTHNETIIHISSPNAAVALALAEAEGRSGAEALTAMALGSELTCRFGLVAPGQFHKHGFHPSGIFGTLGATCTAARLLRLDARETVSALGIAGSFASGLIECWTDGTDTQFLHPGWSAQAGIKAARLAKAGFSGPATVLEGRFGLFASHLQDKAVALDFARATAGLGTAWESRKTSFKPYPCAHIVHPFLDAALALRHQHGIRAEDIAGVECKVAAYATGVMCEPVAEKVAPPNDTRARVSLQWSIAEALTLGRLDGHAYAEASLADPAIRELARRVRYSIDATAPGTERYKGWVIVELRDGRRLERVQEHNHGSLADPMTPEEIRAKFEANAARALPAGRLPAIVRAVETVDEAPGVAGLIDLCIADGC
jgi:2-methylcitrate dehydratase PrpD